jgi:hypothetical protein
MLREADLHLPRTGWGRIVLAASASASRAGRAWTDERTAHQERGLKHRAGNETRTVPIPRSWCGGCAHIKRFGATADGRVFRTARGGILQDSGCNEVWDAARRGPTVRREGPSGLRLVWDDQVVEQPWAQLVLPGAARVHRVRLDDGLRRCE